MVATVPYVFYIFVKLEPLPYLNESGREEPKMWEVSLLEKQISNFAKSE
jgi:hypothetical protein